MKLCRNNCRNSAETNGETTIIRYHPVRTAATFFQNRPFSFTSTATRGISPADSDALRTAQPSLLLKQKDLAGERSGEGKIFPSPSFTGGRHEVRMER